MDARNIKNRQNDKADTNKNYMILIHISTSLIHKQMQDVAGSGIVNTLPKHPVAVV